MDRLRRALLAAAIAAGAVVAGATPAYAHGAGGVQPTNYRTTVESVSPACRGSASGPSTSASCSR